MIFRNAHCIFPDGIRDRFEIVAREGKIENIRDDATSRDGDEVVDLEGNYLAPGFVDLHVHGAVGHDTMEASAEAFRAICDYHATGGTTSLLLTTATAPIDQIGKVLDAVRDCRPSIYQIVGVHVEGPFISKNQRGAQRPDFIQDPTPELVEQLLGRVDLIRRITIAPELPGALTAIEKFFARGVSVSGGHSDAWENEAEAAFACGMRSATHTFNCMSSARREGIFRKAGLLEFALGEPEISCELIADGYHVSPALMKMLYRAKGSAAICLVTDATAGAGLPNKSKFSLAGLDCVVENGVALLADGSALAGSTARMIDLVRTLVRVVDVPLHEAILMATDSPARAIGLKSKGRLAVGYDADFTVISPELNVVRTIVAAAL
ncbi:MAG TPA: N-acetylglucosamine-6-phosphate deacetylase [Chthoniobacterales bacterium]|nr:N-acetylglucosamine-6-phosphate deacetylase [Chthoniobacterales bacterium]